MIKIPRVSSFRLLSVQLPSLQLPRLRLPQLAAAVVPMLLSASAFGQGKVVTISEVTIVGRVQKPIAAVDVARIQPKMTLAELRQPFLDRISEAIYRAPF